MRQGAARASRYRKLSSRDYQMLWILRHLIAIAVLPFSVTVLVPIWLADRTGMTLVVGSSATRIALQACGLGSR